jgi:hypothetical protein
MTDHKRVASRLNVQIMRDNRLDEQVAAALGWQEYTATPWEPVEDAEEKGAMRRQVLLETMLLFVFPLMCGKCISSSVSFLFCV